MRELAAGPGAVIVCGRFEGVDQRVIEARELEEVSVGDYILSGGEPAALVLLDAVVRLLPGVMGNEASGDHESFENGLLEYPHYTRPQEFEGRPIPEVLISGNHAKIAAWRHAEAERLTAERRPDLNAAPHSARDEIIHRQEEPNRDDEDADDDLRHALGGPDAGIAAERDAGIMTTPAARQRRRPDEHNHGGRELILSKAAGSACHCIIVALPKVT